MPWIDELRSLLGEACVAADETTRRAHRGESEGQSSALALTFKYGKKDAAIAEWRFLKD